MTTQINALSKIPTLQQNQSIAQTFSLASHPPSLSSSSQAIAQASLGPDWEALKNKLQQAPIVELKNSLKFITLSKKHFIWLEWISGSGTLVFRNIVSLEDEHHFKVPSQSYKYFGSDKKNIVFHFNDKSLKDGENIHSFYVLNLEDLKANTFTIQNPSSLGNFLSYRDEILFIFDSGKLVKWNKKQENSLKTIIDIVPKVFNLKMEYSKSLQVGNLLFFLGEYYTLDHKTGENEYKPFIAYLNLTTSEKGLLPVDATSNMIDFAVNSKFVFIALKNKVLYYNLVNGSIPNNPALILDCKSTISKIYANEHCLCVKLENDEILFYDKFTTICSGSYKSSLKNPVLINDCFIWDDFGKFFDLHAKKEIVVSESSQAETYILTYQDEEQINLAEYTIPAGGSKWMRAATCPIPKQPIQLPISQTPSSNTQQKLNLPAIITPPVVQLPTIQPRVVRRNPTFCGCLSKIIKKIINCLARLFSC